mmetsp:Transcript_12418/g.28044  ORF Transcript_12418/g.28044 Transcript_12418/m.28044 type:complete len:241 (-) Transcript_12418:618-1340(-)
MPSTRRCLARSRGEKTGRLPPAYRQRKPRGCSHNLQRGQRQGGTTLRDGCAATVREEGAHLRHCKASRRRSSSPSTSTRSFTRTRSLSPLSTRGSPRFSRQAPRRANARARRPRRTRAPLARGSRRCERTCGTRLAPAGTTCCGGRTRKLESSPPRHLRRCGPACTPRRRRRARWRLSGRAACCSAAASRLHCSQVASSGTSQTHGLRCRKCSSPDCESAAFLRVKSLRLSWRTSGWRPT